jgi:trans-aconitate methyltransferase
MMLSHDASRTSLAGGHQVLQTPVLFSTAPLQKLETARERKTGMHLAIISDMHGNCFACEHVLELACGTGTWTQVLLAIGLEITAIDAAPEMLEIARQKLRNARVHYQQADLFQWEPEQEYHLVFFANWLSHVPPEELDTFLSRVAHAVRPGGYVAIIDQYAPTPEDRQIMKKGEGDHIYAQRLLRSGKTFAIIKMFHDVMVLQEVFTALGFEAMSYQLNESFFFLEACRY